MSAAEEHLARLRSSFATRLLAWQREHGRHQLPWQGTRDPYRIWVAEIMLQQTRVETVIPYYQRFLQRFPDLATLAAATVDEVLALWSGLGYYARARNLHRSAGVVVTEQGGRFPRTAAAIATLPGIGRSTAAAIAAFAEGERGPILDGNVKRVLCRVFGVDGFPGDKGVERRLWQLAADLLPEREIARYIQAQMDFGATLCTRARPDCARCPFQHDCLARISDRVAHLPAPRPRKAVPRRSARLAVLTLDDKVLLQRRPPSGIWGGLLALPEIPATESALASWAARELGIEATVGAELAPLVHVFTHFVLEMQPVHLHAHAPAPALAESTLIWLPLAALDGAALPAPVRRILVTLAAETPPAD